MLLDTTVLIDYLLGRPAVERVTSLLAHGDKPRTSPVNVEETIRGLRAPATAAVEQLIDGLRIVPIGERKATRLVNGGASSRPSRPRCNKRTA